MMVKHKWQSKKFMIRNYISASQGISSIRKSWKVNKSKPKELSFVEYMVFLFKLIFM